MIRSLIRRYERELAKIVANDDDNHCKTPIKSIIRLKNDVDTLVKAPLSGDYQTLKEAQSAIAVEHVKNLRHLIEKLKDAVYGHIVVTELNFLLVDEDATVSLPPGFSKQQCTYIVSPEPEIALPISSRLDEIEIGLKVINLAFTE